MMEPVEQRCDAGQIDDYLAGRLDAEQQERFEAHLTECGRCRGDLEARAAEREVWDNARSLLSHPGNSRGNDSDGESFHAVGYQPGNMVLDSLAPTDDPEMLGRLGEYEISGVIGVGGMGAVLRGFDKTLRRVVAIKVMAPHLAGSGPARTRFQREARAAATIAHDNIIDIFGVAEANGLPYIVMPYARGPSLQTRIDRSGPLTGLEVVRIGKQIASGLAAAHEHGLVHRDIKPANILLNEGIERLWITDFGVARAIDDASMTKTGVIAGTPQYMSPEQARGECVDYRSDLFSLGSVLYTACTGRAPFRSEAAYGVLRRLTDTEPTPVREINPEIPDWLCHILGRLMAKRAEDRFQSAAEVAELFEGCLAHLQQPTHVALPPIAAASTATNDDAGPARRPNASADGADHRSPHWKRVATAAFLTPILLVLMAAGVWQATSPVDITGTWKGETWATISLSSVDEATGWYDGGFTDAAGNRGAIRLEWSRLQRRYNGRWKSGSGESGSITLRAGGREEVRGAVSADPEAVVTADRPRLRDFSWRRIDTRATPLTTELPDWRSRVGAPQEITVPREGVITQVGDGIRENARVEKGEVIAVLAPFDTERRLMLENQLSAMRQTKEAGETVVSVMTEAVDVAKQNLLAAEQQLATFETIRRETIAAAEAVINARIANVEAAKAKLAEAEADAKQIRSEYESGKLQHERAKISNLEFQRLKAKLSKAEAALVEAEAVVRSAESEVVTQQRERDMKDARVQVEVNDAASAVRNAQTGLFEAEAKLANAQANVLTAHKKAQDLEVKLSEQKRFELVAPASGYLTAVAFGPDRQQTFKAGDVLFLLWPETDAAEERRKPAAAVEP